MSTSEPTPEYGAPWLPVTGRLQPRRRRPPVLEPEPPTEPMAEGAAQGHHQSALQGASPGEQTGS